MIRVFGIWMMLTFIHGDMASIRELYTLAIYSKEATTQLLDELENTTLEEPLKYAYKGATYALLAQFQGNPYSKLESVKTGSSLLDDAVIAAPNNMEVRYLRYSIESNIPSFLPYRKHIAQDESRIVYALIQKKDGIDPEIRMKVVQYMLKNAQLSPEIKSQLEEQVN